MIDMPSAVFGSVTIGDESPPTVFTISNVGDAASGAPAATLLGDSGSFTIEDDGCTAAIAPGASCQLSVRFAPASAGSKTASLQVSATPGDTVVASLEGTGITPGALSISADTNALGSVVVGTTSTTTATFTVTNTGQSPSGPLNVQRAGSDPGQFTKPTDGCDGQTLAAGASCMFTARFAPHSAGPKSATFDVSATPGGAVTGAVNGVGLSPAHLATATNQLGFGSVVVTQTSSALTVIVLNDGDVMTGTLAQTIEGPFTATGTCDAASLAPSSTCSVTLRFLPTALGAATGALRLEGAPGGTLTIALGGVGIAAGQLSIDPTTHAFGTMQVGQTGAAQQFTITNDAAVASGVLSTALVGVRASQFRIVAGADTCTGTSLNPGASCTISAAFSPTVGGLASAGLLVGSPQAGNVTAELSGVALAPASLAIEPAARDYGSVVIGTQAATQAFVVTNTGGQSSGVALATLGGTNASAFTIVTNGCTAALAPQGSCTVTVRFAPAALGASTAVLDVAATPGGSVSADLSGNGIAAGGLVLVPSSFGFPGITTIGDVSAAQTFTLANTGSAATGTLAITTTGDFAQTHDCGTTLAAGATCTITATFAPTARGLRLGKLEATATSGGTVSAGLSGSARPRLEIVALDGGAVVDPFAFGEKIVGNTIPRDVFITVRNNTAADQTLALTEAFSGQFSTLSNTCSGTIDAAGGTCIVGVRFAPTSVGVKTGSITFSIGSGAANEAVQNLTGTGIAALVLTALDGTDFGSVPRNTTSPTLTFRVTNPTGSPVTGVLATTLTASEIAIVSDTCDGATLVGAESCLIGLAFSPTVTGIANATLTVTAAPGGAPSIAVTGSGVDPIGAVPTDIAVTPSSIAENQPAGTQVGTFTTTDADTGDTFTYALVGGTGSSDNGSFTIAGNVLRTNDTFDFETVTSLAIRVRVTDSGGQIFEKSLAISVTNVDEPPVAVNDAFTVAEDSGATAFDVLANDTDVDGGPKSIASVTQPAHGTVVITGSGTGLTYAPSANYFGGDSFSYTLNGGSPGTVTITVTAVDDAPVAVGDAATVGEDSGATAIDVLANDTDIDGGPRMVTAVTQGANGTVVITGGGTGVTYQPATNFAGTDLFTYTLNGGSVAMVTITVTPSDDAPTAVNDTVNAVEDTPITFDVRTNDTDVDGGTLSVASVTQPTNGAVTINGDGTLTYVPAANFNGLDPFTYTLNGGSTATATMDVAATNDAPVLANGSTLAYTENDPATIIDAAITVSDVDSANLTGATITITTNYESAEDVLTFVNTAQITGTFDATAGRLTLTGTATLASYQAALRAVRYANMSDAPSTGARIVSFQVDDGAAANRLSNVLTSTINVSAANDSPVLANGSTLSYSENQAAAPINTAITVSDADSANLTGATIAISANFASGEDVLAFTNTAAISASFNATTGVLTLTGTTSVANYQAALRAVRYANTSDAPSTATRTATFQVSDGAGSSNVVTSTIDVTAVEDAPVVVTSAGNAVYGEGASAIVVDSGATISDADDGTLASVTIEITNCVAGQDVLELASAVVTVTPTGTCLLTLTAGANVAAYQSAIRAATYRNTSENPSTTARVVRFTADDGSATGSATRNVTVVAVDDVPTAVNDSATVSQDSTANVLDVLANDLDVDGGAIAIAAVGDPANGTTAIVGSTITYTPDAEYCNHPPGTLDTFTYTLTPGGSVGTVSVRVNCDEMFLAPRLFTTGATPHGVSVADFNADGRPDVAIPNLGGSTVSILLGEGDGSLGAPASFAVGAQPSEIAIGDFNADGKPDLAVTTRSTNAVNVLLGVGDGTFGTATAFATGITPTAVAIADFNADGRPDLAVANRAANTISVLLGQGNGTFVAGTAVATGNFPNSLAIADFNGDGRPDMAVTNRNTNTIGVFLGQGNGTFAAMLSFAALSAPNNLAVGDFNADGKPDIVATNRGSNAVSVLLGQGNGTFAAATSIAAGTGSTGAVVVRDLDADGALDLAVANRSGTLAVLIGQGNGTFAAPTTYSYPSPNALAVADFNGDGAPDLAVTSRDSSAVSILLGTGGGLVHNLPTALAVGSNPSAVAVGDLNADGRPDLAVTNRSSNTVSVLLGQNGGTFAAATSFAAGSFPNSVAIADVNKDGKPDLAVTSRSTNTVNVLIGQGNGTFAAQTSFAVGSTPNAVAVGDFNADGSPDLAVTNRSSNTVSVLLGQGNGVFNAATSLAVGALPSAVAIADFNADSKLDIAVTNRNSNTVSILIGQGNGTFAAATSFAVGAAPNSVEIADLTGDGSPDLVITNRNSSNVSVLVGQGNGSFAAATAFAVGSPAPNSVAIRDFDGDGTLDLVVADRVGSFAILLGAPNGSFGAPTRYWTGSGANSIVSADFDANGKLDLAVVNPNTSTASIVFGN